MVKSLVILCDQSPIGRNSVIEAIRFAAGLGAIEDKVKRNLVITGDAILVLKLDFKPEIMEMQSFNDIKTMAEMSELIISVSKPDLEKFGLEKKDLVPYEFLNLVTEEEIGNLIINADASFKF
ncbi:MAG: hypothetical protein P8Y70_12275 [Candidatus Lokiarchaeota archaeon]